MDSRLILSAAELSSHTWAILADYVEKQITLLREQNDAPLDEIKTAELRGEIRGLKKLLSAGKEKPTPIRITGQA